MGDRVGGERFGAGRSSKGNLELIREGHNRWTRLEKRCCSLGFGFATSNTVKRQFYGYLLRFGYVERVERGKYTLTEKGRKLLALLS